MARKPRIHIPGALYHVICRGNGGQPLFLSDDDRNRFYLLLQEVSCRYGYRIHAFCLMPNHIHLALQVGDIPLSRGMQNLSFRYTRWINRQQKRTGHLFQGRYKAVMIDANSYLLELVRYIHLNPVRAGMTKNLEKYSWSSHLAYLGKEIVPCLTTDWVLEQFGERGAKARLAYRNFLLDGLREGHRPEFHGKGKGDSRLLGDDTFLDRCLFRLPRAAVRLTVLDVVEGVCREYGLAESAIKSSSQNRKASEARAVAGWLVREFECATLSEVGKLLNRDGGSMSSAVRRLIERMQESTEVAARVLLLKAALDKTTCQLGGQTP